MSEGGPVGSLKPRTLLRRNPFGWNTQESYPGPAPRIGSPVLSAELLPARVHRSLDADHFRLWDHRGCAEATAFATGVIAW
jgi:hypothetical protein